jgi:hypothetical protein
MVSVNKTPETKPDAEIGFGNRPKSEQPKVIPEQIQTRSDA